MNALSAGPGSIDDNDGPSSIIQKMLKFRNNESSSFEDYLEE